MIFHICPYCYKEFERPDGWSNEHGLLDQLYLLCSEECERSLDILEQWLNREPK